MLSLVKKECENLIFLFRDGRLELASLERLTHALLCSLQKHPDQLILLQRDLCDFKHPNPVLLHCLRLLWLTDNLALAPIPLWMLPDPPVVSAPPWDSEISEISDFFRQNAFSMKRLTAAKAEFVTNFPTDLLKVFSLFEKLRSARIEGFGEAKVEFNRFCEEKDIGVSFNDVMSQLDTPIAELLASRAVEEREKAKNAVFAFKWLKGEKINFPCLRNPGISEFGGFPMGCGPESFLFLPASVCEGFRRGITEDFLELPSEERTKRNFLSLELLICEVHDLETGETGWLPYRELQTGTFSAGSRTAAAERAVRRFFAAEREEISDHAVDAAIVRLMKSVRVEPIEELSRKFPEKNVKSLIAREFLAVQRSEGGREYVVYVP